MRQIIRDFIILLLFVSCLGFLPYILPAEATTYGKTKVNVIKIVMSEVNPETEEVKIRPIAEVEYILETMMRHIPLGDIKQVSHVLSDEVNISTGERREVWIYTIWYTEPVIKSTTEKISDQTSD